MQVKVLNMFSVFLVCHAHAWLFFLHRLLFVIVTVINCPKTTSLDWKCISVSIYVMLCTHLKYEKMKMDISRETTDSV